MNQRFIDFLVQQLDRATATAPNPEGKCLEENTWALLADDALSPRERESLVEHISQCAACRRVACEIISEWHAAPADGAESGRPSASMLRRLILSRAVGVYAAAAVVILGVGLYFLSSRTRRSEDDLLARAAHQIAVGQYEAAERELAAAMERGKASAAVMQLRGQALMGAALAMTAPGSAKLTSLGHVGILQRRTKELPTIPVPESRLKVALAMLREAANATPGSQGGWRDLGTALVVARRFQEAADAFGRWVQIDPDSAQAYNAHGLALYGAEQFAEAALAFQRASAVATEVSAYELNAAIACEEAGQLEQARRHGQRFLELEPTGRDADEVRTWLSYLGKDNP